MEQLMKCMNCSKKFRATITFKKPMFSSCGHSICNRCVTKHVNEDRNRIRCGKCNKLSSFARKNFGAWTPYGFNISLMDVIANHGTSFQAHGKCITECNVCFFPMTTSRARIPRILPCGHTCCKTCLSKLSLPTKRINCYLCRDDERFIEARCPTNRVLYEFLRHCENTLPKCEAHPDYFCFFVFRRPGGDGKLICFECTKEEPYQGLHIDHVNELAKLLRERIDSNFKILASKAKQYEEDSKTFEEIKSTFSQTHPDYDFVTKLVKKRYIETPGCDLEKKEIEEINKFCLKKIEIMEEQRQEREKIFTTNTIEVIRLIRLRDPSDVNIVKNVDQCDLRLRALPTISFENERLLNFFMKSATMEVKKYFLITVYLKNQGADAIFMRLVGWCHLNGRKHGIEAYFDGELAILTRQEKKFRIVIKKTEVEGPPGSCIFRLNDCQENLYVVMNDGKVEINGKKTLDPDSFSWLANRLCRSQL